MPISRRVFLRHGAQAISAASLLATVPALAVDRDQNQKAPDVTVTDVGGLAVFAGSGCNVVGLAGPDGALLVDGGLAAGTAALLKAVAQNLKTPRVQTLLNTHWHPEQTGSNETMGKGGATLISHEVTKLALGRKERSALYEGFYGPLPPKAIPTQTTYNTGSLDFAGEPVAYRYLPAAHTNGDLFIHFPKRNVIAAGGPVAADHWPVMDYLNGAFMHGFVRSYEILAEVAKPDTIIVPANGPTLTGADIVRQKDMYWALFKQFFIFFNKGYGPHDVVDAHPLQEHEAQYGDPAQFLEYAYRSLQLATIPV
jgi:glyoxylase-like metal-dependent hydrolase (beta-lactamase superfamily II)